MSPIAGEKVGAMEIDVRRAVGEGVVRAHLGMLVMLESLPSEYEVSKVFSTPIPPTGSDGSYKRGVYDDGVLWLIIIAFVMNV